MELLNCKNGIPSLCIHPFSLKRGEILLLYLPSGENIQFCKKNKKLLQAIYEPYWVNFSMEKLNRESVNIINQNRKYLNCFFSSVIPNRDLTEKDISLFSGWDIRLINMFLKRKQCNVDFFEINIAGLSISSILLMLEFIVTDSKFGCSYLIIDPVVYYKINPIAITDTNYKDIYTQVYFNNHVENT